MILNQNNFLDFDLQGKVIVFPTDTVYGIGCLYKDKESIKKIYDIKNRDYSKPMVILCADMKQIREVIKEDQEIPNRIKKHWPGALTIIVFKNEKIYDIITSGRNTVGVRIPSNPISLRLLKKHGPMVVTSLNLSNEPAVLKYKDALNFEDLVDYVIEGEDLNSPPSTVYDLTSNKVLRQGEIIIE